MVGINPNIILLVYVRTLAILQNAVDAAKSIEAGYRITQRNGTRSNFVMQQLTESEIEVLAVTLEKIFLKREEKRFF